MSELFPVVTYNFSTDNFSVIEDYLPIDEEEANTSNGYNTTVVSYLTLGFHLCTFVHNVAVWITH